MCVGSVCEWGAYVCLCLCVCVCVCVKFFEDNNTHVSFLFLLIRQRIDN